MPELLAREACGGAEKLVAQSNGRILQPECSRRPSPWNKCAMAYFEVPPCVELAELVACLVVIDEQAPRHR